MNYSDITVSIVTFKSEKVIFKCLKSIKKVKKIIIFDNSNDISLKKAVINKYPNIEYILSNKNIGYGAAHNKVFKLAKILKVSKKYKNIKIIDPDIKREDLFPIPDEEIYNYISRSKFHMLNSYREGVPRVIIESLYLNTKVIFSNKLISPFDIAISK